MAIESVDMNRALTSETYAAQCIRSGKLTGSQRGQLASKWGADKIKLWESVDSTSYKISDEDWNSAKNAGYDKAKDATGHDGSKQSWVRVGGDALISLGTGAGAIWGGQVNNLIGGDGAKKWASGVNDFFHGSEGRETNSITGKATQSEGKDLSDILTVTLGVAAAANYQWNRPNEDQYNAAMVLFDAKDGSGGLLIDGQYSLDEAQDIMKEATEETTELTEEADELNEEANESIDDDKTNFDFFRKQYEYLKAKAESGEELTPDEKQLLKKLAPLMEEAAANIGDTQEKASADLEDKYNAIEGYQGQYDTGAETIAEVQGLTDFAEGFDSTTRTMAYVEGVSQGITGALTGAAAVRLATKGALSFGATLGFALAGGVAAVRLGLASAEQFKWAGHLGQEIDAREATQELNEATQDVYDEELDNFAGNMDIIEDMEIEVPDDLNLPGAVTEPSGDGDNVDPLAAGAAGNPVDGDDGSVGDGENNPEPDPDKDKDK